MNHPDREAWVPYLFGEAKADERRRLDEHLQDCPECRAEIAGWRRSLRRLDVWKLPKARKPQPVAAPLLKWAMASGAVAMLSLGFIVGRLTSAPPDLRQVQAAIEPELRQEFGQLLRRELDKAVAKTLAASRDQTQTLLADYAAAVETQRAEDAQAVGAALQKLDAQHAADVLALKKDLDTVAVTTDAILRQTARQLVELADYARPVDSSLPPEK